MIDLVGVQFLSFQSLYPLLYFTGSFV